MTQLQHPSLLAHLAGQLAPHPENIATEALFFILKRSPSSAATMNHILRSAGLVGDDVFGYRTQVSDEDGARPDLIALGQGGRVEAFVEAKFWAGLTDNQPNGYLHSALLRGHAGGVLFVAPEKRLPTLWPELVRRVRESNQPHSPAVAAGFGERILEVGTRRMALVSWRFLLGRLSEAAQVANDNATLEDLRQLASLCDQMDSRVNRTGFRGGQLA